MARTKSFDERLVLKKALNLFWAKGYHATSIQDLVDHLKINRASIYSTWGDKHNLYLETLKLYRKINSNWLLELVRSAKPAHEILANFLQYAIDETQPDQVPNGCYLVNATTELAHTNSDVDELVTDYKETVIKVLSAIIEDGKTQGQITSKHSSLDLATSIFSIANGLRIMKQSNTDSRNLQVTVKIALSVLD